TVRTFYEQMSNGQLHVHGTVLGWIQLDSNDTWYAGSCNGLCGSGHVAQMIAEAVQKTDATVDFGQFDNDGPDGVPNSGDDDGYVDVVNIVQPEVGAECGGLVPSAATNLWSHRFYYQGWTGSYVNTNDLAHNGLTTIKINDYTLSSALGG